MKRNWLRIVLVVVSVVPLTAGGFALWIRSELLNPVSHAKANDYIEIPRGSSPDAIAAKLVNEGVLRKKWPLLFYIKLTGSARLIRSGDYRFPSPITPMG